MGYMCDFCGDQRSTVYCRSDAASLCLSCDRSVHSANALSKRHSRTLLCERCNSQPALMRCLEERISLCQNCDWSIHGSSTSTSTHKRQTINCYSGCPSSEELSSLWAFTSDFSSAGESACEQKMGLMSIDEDCSTTAWGPPRNSVCQSLSAIAGTSSMSELIPNNLDQPARSATAPLPKLRSPETSGPGICEDDDLYEDFNMDEMDLNLENYDELFGVTLSNSEELFENGRFNSLFTAKDMSGAESNCQGAVAAEGSSVGLGNAMQPACSTAAYADSMMSAKTEPVLCFMTRQGHSSLSFSGLTRESSAADYQDCGASSMLLMGEPPWCLPCAEGSFPSANRSDAVLRYKEYVVKTSRGSISVYVCGDQDKPALITYPDVALNYMSCFQGLFFFPEAASLLLHNFCIYHIDAPGHELGADVISSDVPVLSVDDLADQVAEVLDYFGLKEVFCLGVTAGAYIPTLFANFCTFSMRMKRSLLPNNKG